MSLASKTSAVTEQFKANAPPEVLETIFGAVTDLKSSFDPSSVVQVGATLPPFVLPNASGKEVRSSDLLTKGPLLITFYRGDWCPFCNLALRALQERLDDIRAKGVTLVAITPELPDTTLSTTEKLDLKFEVLSDVGNKFAARLGISWQQPDTLRPIFDKFGHDLPKRNGDDSFTVPIPATFLVDGKGVVRNSYIEPDYTKRFEPSVALEWVDAL